MNPKLDFIFNRRSIRSFEDKPVSKEDINSLLEAAMAAPSAHNAQPWHFVAVTDREKLDQLANVHKYAKMLKEATLCIAVCGQGVINDIHNSMWPQDCAAATQNILLAATALNLGSVWLGIYPSEKHCPNVSKMLDIPEHITPFSLIAIGHPVREKEARTQYNEEKVHWEKW